MVDTMISEEGVKMEERYTTVLRELEEETNVCLNQEIEKKIVYQ
jgi:8-oxo-dGTP pyrophosphatase MutT (NUDIX family)